MQGESQTETLKSQALCQKNSTVGRSGQALAAPVVFNPCLRTTREECGLPRWHSGKESACNAGDPGDTGSIPGSGRSPGVGNGTPLYILVWKIPWAEEPGGLQSWGHKE